VVISLSSAVFSQCNPVLWQRLVIEVDGLCSKGWDITPLPSVRCITSIPQAKMQVSCIVKCKDERIQRTTWCGFGPLLLHIFDVSFTDQIVH
jgi:hypothetical protein